MEKNKDLQPIKRRRINPTYRWRDEHTLELIEKVVELTKDSSESYEKPTSQRFYEKIKSISEKLKSVSWVCMKTKMRYCKASFISANNWKNQTGSRMLVAGEEKSVSDYIAKVCPHYELLYQIFGEMKNVSSTTPAEKYTHLFGKIYKFHKSSNSSNNISQEALVEELSSDSDDPDVSCSTPCKDDLYEVDESNDAPMISKRHEEQIKKYIKSCSLSMLPAIEKQKLGFEQQKIDWQIEKEKQELEQNYKLKILEIERDERLEREKFILQKQLEEKLRMYELDLKYKINKSE